MNGKRWLVLAALAASGWSCAAQGPVASARAPIPADPELAAAEIPDSPGQVWAETRGMLGLQRVTTQPTPVPCPAGNPGTAAAASGASAASGPSPMAASPCVSPTRERYARFLDTTAAAPLTPKQKGYLSFRDIVDPFNVLTVVGNSAFSIAIDSHTAYGPGFKGFGKNVGVSLLQDATGEVIGTFAVCSLFHEDPHYHRLPEARPMRRVFHAISRTVVAQSDEGRRMPNLENFITYPASAELSNLYVPGVQGNGWSTAQRVALGLATDPLSNLITEFLPDFARRVHIRVVFVQQILNQVASGEM